jgi:hypothetical protein
LIDKMLGIVVDTTLNLNTIIVGIAFPILFLVLQRHWKKQGRTHKIFEIKLDATAETLFYSANGRGEDLKIHYQKKVDEGMKEAKFVDGE